MRLEQLPPLAVRQVDGVRRGHEVHQHLDEALGRLAVREVTHLIENGQAAAGHGLMRRDGVTDGDERILRPPDDLRR